MGARKSGMLLAGVALLGVLALAGRGSAGPGDGIAAALARGKARLHCAAIGSHENTSWIRFKDAPTLARFDIETHGKPLSPTDAASIAKALADSLEPMGCYSPIQVEVDIYARGRLMDRGASNLNRIGRHTESNNPSGALWVLNTDTVDVSAPVTWYMRVVWWRSYTLRAEAIVDTGKWQATYWRAEGNAVAAGEEGSSAAHLPKLVK